MHPKFDDYHPVKAKLRYESEKGAEAASMNVSGLGNLPVFPCASDKRPLVKAWPTAAERIEPKPSWPLVGVPTGITFSVLDIDLDGLSWLASATLPPTRTHVTRSGGRHLLFRHREGLRTSKGQIAPRRRCSWRRRLRYLVAERRIGS